MDLVQRQSSYSDGLVTTKRTRNICLSADFLAGQNNKSKLTFPCSMVYTNNSFFVLDIGDYRPAKKFSEEKFTRNDSRNVSGFFHFHLHFSTTSFQFQSNFRPIASVARH